MRSSFWHEGYALIEGMFDPEELAALRHDAQGVFCRQIVRLGLAADEQAAMARFEPAMFELFKREPTLYMNCGKQVQHLLSLHRLGLDPRILGVIGELGLEAPAISTRPVLFFHHRETARHEAYWKVPAHQDWSSMQGSADSLVVWLPLTDVDAPLGPLEIIPGSHRRGLRASTLIEGGFGELPAQSIQPDEVFTPVPMKAGDALIFSSMMVHRSGDNRSGRFRWSCNFRYNNLAEESFIGRGYPHAYLYRPVDEELTPGFDTEKAILAVCAKNGP